MVVYVDIPGGAPRALIFVSNVMEAHRLTPLQSSHDLNQVWLSNFAGAVIDPDRNDCSLHSGYGNSSTAWYALHSAQCGLEVLHINHSHYKVSFSLIYLFLLLAPKTWVTELFPIVVALVFWFFHDSDNLNAEKRIQCERTYVSSLADILENTLTFRGLGATNVRKVFWLAPYKSLSALYLLDHMTWNVIGTGLWTWHRSFLKR